MSTKPDAIPFHLILSEISWIFERCFGNAKDILVLPDTKGYTLEKACRRLWYRKLSVGGNVLDDSMLCWKKNTLIRL